jgi:hypothetical protein
MKNDPYTWLRNFCPGDGILFSLGFAVLLCTGAVPETAGAFSNTGGPGTGAANFTWWSDEGRLGV